MTLTREILLARRKRFDDERDSLLAQANARVGMIAEIDALLTLLEAPEPPPVPPGLSPAPKPAQAAGTGAATSRNG